MTLHREVLRPPPRKALVGFMLVAFTLADLAMVWVALSACRAVVGW